MNIVVFAPKKRIIDRFRFPKFKSSGMFTNFATDGIATDPPFDGLDIRPITNGYTLCPGFISFYLISG
jgi:hypothetical protein